MVKPLPYRETFVEDHYHILEEIGRYAICCGRKIKTLYMMTLNKNIMLMKHVLAGRSNSVWKCLVPSALEIELRVKFDLVKSMKN
jgi:hypothetical protein